MHRIIVVEDEWVIRQAIVSMVKRMPMFQIVGEADNGEVALELLLELKPHILLTDIRIPKLNGLLLAEKAKQGLPNLEIVLFSGYSDFEYVREGLRQGAFDYLLKPVQPEELERVLLQLSAKLSRPLIEASQKLQWMEVGHQYAKRLAEHLWKIEQEAMIDVWNEMITEWQNDAQPDNIFEQYRQLMYWINDHIREQYGGKLPERYTQVPAFTNQMDEDMTLLLQLLINIQAELQIQRNWHKNNLVEKVISYINSNYADAHLSLQQAADYAGMSSSYLSRSFKEEIGKSFVEYVTDLRIGKSRSLLADPNRRVYEVGDMVGYPVYAYFTRVFKKEVGYTPSDYRKLIGLK